MNVRELRIGNFIQETDTGHLYCVDAIGANTLLSLFEPIPLTEEWLLSFGFKHDGVFYKHSCGIGFFGIKGLTLMEAITFSELDISDSFNTIAWKMTSSIIINGENPRFYFVHQLQNLYFALTGQELKIEIKKKTPI